MNWLRFTIILLFTSVVDLTYAQQLSSKAKQIISAFAQLKKHPDSKEDQLNYIKIFPENSTEFLQIFDPSDFGQLYDDSYQYIEAFVKLGKYYPIAIIKRSITIGKSLVWQADATGQIQQEIVLMGNTHPAIFIKLVKSLNAKEQIHLITFLADAENYSAYPEYKQLIKSITNAGEKRLAKQFIDAMHKREKQNHD
jgi:hypothetical protein